MQNFKKVEKQIPTFFSKKKSCQGALNGEGYIFEKSIVCNVNGFVYKIIIVKKLLLKK